MKRALALKNLKRASGALKPKTRLGALKLMQIKDLEIPEVKLITPRRFVDDRGFFTQTYHALQYKDAGISATFVQDNWSRSCRGVLRGLHYQLKNPQAKLVGVVRGAVFDVAVDIRKGSPTFGKWVGAELTEENGCQLYVPEGFAHGFCVLSDVVDFTYKCGDLYTPGDEYGIRWDDPAVGIEWPSAGGAFALSGKDEAAPLLSEVSDDALPVWEGGAAR
jgi:dTDP-4-dehydrorhamnose 3,5-epimerase